MQDTPPSGHIIDTSGDNFTIFLAKTTCIQEGFSIDIRNVLSTTDSPTTPNIDSKSVLINDNMVTINYIKYIKYNMS